MLDSIACSFTVGRLPGSPMHTGHTFVFGPSPNSLAHPQNIFVFVFNSTWTSKPSTGSYSSIAFS